MEGGPEKTFKKKENGKGKSARQLTRLHDAADKISYDEWKNSCVTSCEA